jgi:uncharacterized protein
MDLFEFQLTVVMRSGEFKSMKLIAAFILVSLMSMAVFGVQKTSSVREDTATQPSSIPITIGETFHMQSKRLGEDRRISVYLPHSYQASRHRYPVIYTLDGEITGPVTANAVNFMTESSSLPQMPEALVVAITNTDRNRDMPLPQAYGKSGEEKFLAFLAEELIPLIEQKYRTQPLRILVGHSQGGLFATYALTARPAVFQWYLSLDAPLAGFPEVKPMLAQVTKVIADAQKFRGRLVSIETLYGWRTEWATLVAAAPKGFYGDQIEVRNETHETMVYKGIYEGLKRLFQDYCPKLTREGQGIYTLTTLEQMYHERSQAYGYQVDVPKQLLLTSAAEDIAMQYGAEAVDLIKRAAQLYGESAYTKRLMTEAEEANKRGRDPRLAEWANVPAPAIEEMKPFLGSWEVTTDRAREVVTFESKEGIVRTEYKVTPNGGETFQMDVHFVRVLKDKTLQWGLRNGRGAGIILRTVKLVNENTLQGTAEAVGIEQAPPPRSVTYKRLPGN